MLNCCSSLYSCQYWFRFDFDLKLYQPKMFANIVKCPLKGKISLSWENHCLRRVMTIQFSFFSDLFREEHMFWQYERRSLFRVWGGRKRGSEENFPFWKKKKRAIKNSSLLVPSLSLLAEMLVCINLNLGAVATILWFWGMAEQKDGNSLGPQWHS